jgi:hypothetical protein
MITIDGKNYRNLEEQVEYNKDRLDNLIAAKGVLDEFGIKVVGNVLQPSLVPTIDKYKEAHTDWEYGDAYAVGSSQPYKLYILTRADADHTEDYWFYIGDFPAPGPEGKAGKDGVDGTNGTDGVSPVITATASVTNTIGTPIVTVTKSGTQANPNFYFNFQNIKGEKGDTGATGNTGATGKQGPVGPAFNVYGTVETTSQLPTATAELQDKGAAYLIPIDGVNHLYLIQYDHTDSSTPMWVDVGPAGVQGQQGEQGVAGFGFGNTTLISAQQPTSITYNSSTGATINGSWVVYDAATSQTVNQQANYILPLVNGDEVTFTKSGNYLKASLSQTLTSKEIIDTNATQNFIYYSDSSNMFAINTRNGDQSFPYIKLTGKDDSSAYDGVSLDAVFRLDRIHPRTLVVPEDNPNGAEVNYPNEGEVLAISSTGALEWKDISSSSTPDVPIIPESPSISYPLEDVNWDEYYTDDFAAAALKTGMIKVGNSESGYWKVYHLDEVEDTNSAYYILRQRDPGGDPYIIQATIYVDVVNKRVRLNTDVWANNIA